MQKMKAMKAEKSETDAILMGWMAKPRDVAKVMIAKYGQPNEATHHRLVWWGNGPWKWSILENIEIEHKFPMPHKDMLYQAIDYNMPETKAYQLALYDGSVILERTRGTMGARCDKEGANFLAINLANDVATGKRTWRQARDYYAKAVKAFMGNKWNAEQKRYMTGFTFNVKKTNQGDPDKPHMSMKN